MFQKIEYSSVELKKGTYFRNDILKLKEKIFKIGKITVSCPICFEQKEINIPMKRFASIKNLLSIIIYSGYMCDHSFTVFVDKDLEIRGREAHDLIIS